MTEEKRSEILQNIGIVDVRSLLIDPSIPLDLEGENVQRLLKAVWNLSTTRYFPVPHKDTVHLRVPSARLLEIAESLGQPTLFTDETTLKMAARAARRIEEEKSHDVNKLSLTSTQLNVLEMLQEYTTEEYAILTENQELPDTQKDRIMRIDTRRQKIITVTNSLKGFSISEMMAEQDIHIHDWRGVRYVEEKSTKPELSFDPVDTTPRSLNRLLVLLIEGQFANIIR